jgi:DNA-binding NarL/FixJ family response regulator
VRLLLADDHPGIIEETRSLLAADFDVIGTASDGIDLIKAAEDLHPDVVVTDIRMPRLSGIEASRRILDRRLCLAIIALSVHRDRQFVDMALEAGMLGYVLKETAGEDLARAIRLALDGKRFISAGIDSQHG